MHQRIFYYDDYYEAFLFTLQEAKLCFGLKIHACCLPGDLEMIEELADFYNKERIAPILRTGEFVKGIRKDSGVLERELKSEDKSVLRPSIGGIVTKVASVWGVEEELLYQPKNGRGLKCIINRFDP